MDQHFQQNLQKLRKDVETGFADARDARVRVWSEERDARINATNEVKTATKNIHDQCVKEMERLQSSAASWDNAREQLSTRLTSLEVLSPALRKDIDTINNDFIEPNQELLGLFPTVIMVVGQVQSLLESINQNLPKAPLAIEWHVDLNSMDRASISSSQNKGKSKQ